MKQTIIEGALMVAILIIIVAMLVTVGYAWKTGIPVRGVPCSECYGDITKDELIEMELDEEIEAAFTACNAKLNWETVYAERQERWNNAPKTSDK